MRLIIFLFIGFIFFAACSDCPENIEANGVLLTDESLTWNPYNEVDSLLFKDEENNEHILAKTSSFLNTSVRVSDECFQSVDLQQFSTQFIDQESSNVVIDFIQSVSFIEESGSLEYIDLIEINTVIYGVSTGTISTMSDNRGLLNIAPFSNATFIGDTTILDKTFSNVYCAKPTPNRALLYSLDFGVVYMKWKDGSYWLLEAII